MLEKGRVSMQNQFDSWYNQLQSRGGNIAVGQKRVPQRIFDDSRSVRNTIIQQYYCIVYPLELIMSTLKLLQTLEEDRSDMIDFKNDTNDDRNEDVNEDIAAFYKAKDALLKRREEAK